MGYSLRGPKELDTTERSRMHTTDEKTEAFKDKALDKVTTVVGAKKGFQSGIQVAAVQAPTSPIFKVRT